MVRDVVELRIDVDADVMQLVDALVLARGGKERGIHRADIISPVLQEWYERTVHESTIVQRVLRGKGCAGADRGQDAE
jgi:hypothetical protein